jgi:hypothetical protein
MPYETFTRVAGLFTAALVTTVTSVVVAHAVQTVTTPNATTIAYNLAPGANSSFNISPAANAPVFVMANQSTLQDVGSSDMTVVNSTTDNELVWNGIESNAGGVTAGFSALAGTHMIFIDYSHCVDLEVTKANSYHVHNGCSGSRTGQVTQLW